MAGARTVELYRKLAIEIQHGAWDNHELNE